MRLRLMKAFPYIRPALFSDFRIYAVTSQQSMTLTVASQEKLNASNTVPLLRTWLVPLDNPQTIWGRSNNSSSDAPMRGVHGNFSVISESYRCHFHCTNSVSDPCHLRIMSWSGSIGAVPRRSSMCRQVRRRGRGDFGSTGQQWRRFGLAGCMMEADGGTYLWNLHHCSSGVELQALLWRTLGLSLQDGLHVHFFPADAPVDFVSNFKSRLHTSHWTGPTLWRLVLARSLSSVLVASLRHSRCLIDLGKDSEKAYASRW